MNGDIFVDLQTIPPSSQAIVVGENLSGTPSIYPTIGAAEGLAKSIWNALPFGPLISKIPSANTAAKGAAVAAVNVSNKVGNAAIKVGQAAKTTATAAVSGIEKGLIVVVVLVAGYLLLPALLARRG